MDIRNYLLAKLKALIAIFTQGYKEEPTREQIKVRRTPRKQRKKRDNTRISRDDYDLILEIHKNTVFKYLGTPHKPTAAELTKQLNISMNMDKSPAFYANIWNGHVKRSNLPTKRMYVK